MRHKTSERYELKAQVDQSAHTGASAQKGAHVDEEEGGVEGVQHQHVRTAGLGGGRRGVLGDRELIIELKLFESAILDLP